eukprot:Opistho-1_new@79590
MISLSSISKVGLGMYRMGSGSEEDLAALKYSLDKGYNLLDTATNYRGGRSEMLLGELFEKFPEYAKKAFVVSKVGYIPARLTQSDEMKEFLSNTPIEIGVIEEDFLYSIDPNFIEFQLLNSLNRINRPWIDAYLLHNPERLFQSENLATQEDLYASIHRAFQKLEELVERGIIRYYGISSNACFNPKDSTSVDILKVLEIAKNIKIDHNFKVLEFPYNFMETMAENVQYGTQSLLQIAKENNLITIGNRPFNMNNENKEFRLADYSERYSEDIEDEANAFFKEFTDLLKLRIDSMLGEPCSLEDFEPVQRLKETWQNFTSIEALQGFWGGSLSDFFSVVFEDNKEEDHKQLARMYEYMQAFVFKNITESSQKLMDEAFLKGVAKEENLTISAIGDYLNRAGLNHVVVGMRKREYVDKLLGKYRGTHLLGEQN